MEIIKEIFMWIGVIATFLGLYISGVVIWLYIVAQKGAYSSSDLEDEEII